MGDGRAEGSSAIGDGVRGLAAISLRPDVAEIHICIYERSQLEGSYLGDYYTLSISIFPSTKENQLRFGTSLSQSFLELLERIYKLIFV